MRLFEDYSPAAALRWAAAGGQALYLHPLRDDPPPETHFRFQAPTFPVRTARIYDLDPNRLYRTARGFGVGQGPDAPAFADPGTAGQFLRVCLKPLRYARESSYRNESEYPLALAVLWRWLGPKRPLSLPPRHPDIDRRTWIDGNQKDKSYDKPSAHVWTEGRNTVHGVPGPVLESLRNVPLPRQFPAPDRVAFRYWQDARDAVGIAFSALPRDVLIQVCGTLAEPGVRERYEIMTPTTYERAVRRAFARPGVIDVARAFADED